MSQPLSHQETQAAMEKGKPPLTSVNEATEEVKEREVQVLLGKPGEVTPKELFGTGFTYNHDWGNKHGWWKLNLNWGAVNCNSRVFVSATEFGGGAQCAFIGDAKYLVYNVAPYNGGVAVRVYIDWGADIRVRLSYLVINP